MIGLRFLFAYEMKFLKIALVPLLQDRINNYNDKLEAEVMIFNIIAVF